MDEPIASRRSATRSDGYTLHSTNDVLADYAPCYKMFMRNFLIFF